MRLSVSALVALAIVGGLGGSVLRESSASESGPERVFSIGSSPRSIDAFDVEGVRVPGVELWPRGLARLDRSGALLVRGGYFVVRQAGPIWERALSSPAGFSVEVAGVPASTGPEQSGSLVRLGVAGGAPSFVLSQEGAELFAAFGAGTLDAVGWVRLGTVVPGVEFHAAVVFDGGELRCYLDGLPTGARALGAVRAPAGSAELILGGALDGGAGWAGTVRGLVLHRGALDAAAVAERARAEGERPAREIGAATLVVDAVLVAKSPVPTVAELAPYTQSLTVYEYRVQRVWSGTYESQKLYVAHWTILDGTRLPFAEVSPGGEYRLLLERFDEQPQLQSENFSDSIVEDFSLPWFYDAGGTSLGLEVAAAIGPARSVGPRAASDGER